MAVTAPPDTVFGNTLYFFDRLGIFDVILPFILIFTITFAILEKTKAFGMEEVEGKKYTRKNLNAMVSFVIAFLVVASSSLVNFINTFILGIVILMLIAVFTLVISGVAQKETDEGWFLPKGWNKLFIGLTLVGVALVLLNAFTIETPWGRISMLSYLYQKIAFEFDSVAVSSILLLIVLAGIMAFIIKEPKGAEKKKEN
ncbi:hypothetical protein D6783_00335 [Candidatus Woesearchaeota archaeon]|nr:MAG: hypothetical protein D6783_00335 [Candidatus Woesearchaeota archaeon]